MKRSLYILCAVLLIASTSTSALDRIVAVVEDDVVMESELRQRIQALVQQFKQNRSALPPKNVLVEQVLQRLIIERLQLQLAERRGIQIDVLTLDQAMRNLARRNNMNLEQFRDTLLKQGLDYAVFRNQIRDEMIIEQLRKRIIDQNIQISETEVEELITRSNGELLQVENEYHVAHILIAVPEGPSPEQIENSANRASMVYERAVSGDNFTQLAIAASDAQDALQGGDLGWRDRTRLPQVLVQEIDQMTPGEISKIIQSPSGFHIFKLLGHREIEKETMVDQVLVRHILIRTNALLSDEAAEKKLKDIKSRIEAGEDFAELAKEFSEDLSSAFNGGQLGWAVSGTYVPQFKEVVDALAAKQISEPFRTQFGWHIVQLQDVRKHDNTQAAIRAKAFEQIRQRKIEEETELWLRRLRDESYIENRLHSSN
ncbi:MAG: peptidylprolyl isomerase [Gammaproteobacteria bacterium]|nr:peptidylprolyl isomerase [Gammaproteobacteria bacterium]